MSYVEVGNTDSPSNSRPSSADNRLDRRPAAKSSALSSRPSSAEDRLKDRSGGVPSDE